MTDTVLLAGGSGDLGGRIAKALARRGARVKALVRPATDAAKVEALRSMGAEPVEAAFEDVAAVRTACEGADCVVSALNGLRPVVIGAQTALLDAAVAAGVPRFVPSDFSLDFTKTAPGTNRNLDLRREFMSILDAREVRATSILNGGFASLLAGQAPLIQHKIRRVLYWGSPEQKLDFTTMDDTADFTAAAALDPEAPRILRIAGSEVSARDLARTMTELTGEEYGTLWAGSLGMLRGMIRIAKAVSPDEDAVFPAWQGMQYMANMFSGHGKLSPLDNDRYQGIGWTPVTDVLAGTVS
ncbi:NmrA family NAD(P)-binding protein [Parvularcula dongshanensis]|uniref:Nucleoside-diphosphate-sugar epimerase n=1 Tax=Parvularcula dongshanensis TaxID=1173995 RepID=A0A840I382_9PROT|nr:NmrA family NAD(P)-binding protein [Parvularcula dongshanensis]MBB4659466.1 nucleoside-diphosphate-sugar epimerase [Parvularcula dongshanensis]